MFSLGIMPDSRAGRTLPHFAAIFFRLHIFDFVTINHSLLNSNSPIPSLGTDIMRAAYPVELEEMSSDLLEKG